MHWVEVDGLPMPKRIGGHPALDLCNTWAGWGERPDPRREWIPDYEHLIVWSEYAGLIDTGAAARVRRLWGREPAGAERVVDDVHALRGALYKCLTDPSNGRAFKTAAAYIERAAGAAHFVRNNEGGGEWVVRRDAGLDLPLLAAARSAGDLLSSPDRPRVDRCPGNDCGWLFVNRSGRRRWCDMSSCGNRAKVRAHNERQKRAR